MDALLDFLKRQLPHKLGTVLHLGAGARALELHAGFHAQRLVLVEGDPDTHAELEASIREGDRAIELLGDVVMPASGMVHWRRFSVRAHNGPLARDALLAYYPRLRQWTATPRPGRDIAELLAQLDIRRSSDGPNVLLLDTPGQADSLLRRLSAEAMQCFDWLILTGYRQEVDPALSPSEPPESALEAASFVTAGASVDDSAGPWSFRAWRFDHRQHEHARLLEQLEDASSRAIAAEQHCETLRRQALAEAARWQRQLEEAQASLQAALAERDEARSRALAAEDGLRTEQASAQAALEQQRQAHDTQQARIAELTAERDRQAHWHKENASWARALDAKTKDLQGQLETARQELQQAREQLDTRRDAEASTRADLARELQAQLEGARQELQQALEQLETLRAAETSDRAARSQEREEHARALQEQLRKHQAQTQELESLRQQLARAQEEREAARRSLLERDSRQALLDQEVLRAEAQLDLIKDVLLREKNF